MAERQGAVSARLRRLITRPGWLCATAQRQGAVARGVCQLDPTWPGPISNLERYCYPWDTQDPGLEFPPSAFFPMKK